MHKAEFLDQLQTGRKNWEALLAEFDDHQMVQPGVSGPWSVKDVIAHVTWFEREMVGMLRARALVGSELWNLPPDERNLRIFEENRSRPLDEVKAEAGEVYQELLEALGDITDEHLLDPELFPGMPGDWVPWQVIAGNSFEHYLQHDPDLRVWLEASAG